MKAPALSLAVGVPAGWKQHHSLCHAGPASGAERRRPVRGVGAVWSGWFWGFCSALRSRRDQWPGSDPAIGSANFARRPMRGRWPLWGHLPGLCRWPVVGVVLARASWWPPVEPAALLPRWLFVRDVMAQLSRFVKPLRPPPLWCARDTAPSPAGALRLPVTALGRGPRLGVTGVGPLALVSTSLAEALQGVRVCPEGPAA